MNTTTALLTVVCPVDDSILQQFLKPDHEVMKSFLTLWNLRGNLTQTESDHTRRLIGDEKYEHYNWDTVACNGRVLVLIPRYKHPHGEKPKFGTFTPPAEWFWCFEQIEVGEDIAPASPADIARVPEELREKAAILPGLEWITVQQVNSIEYGNGKPKHKHRPPPDGIMFFRFNGGVGLTVAVRKGD